MLELFSYLTLYSSHDNIISVFLLGIFSFCGPNAVFRQKLLREILTEYNTTWLLTNKNLMFYSGWSKPLSL